MLGDIVKVTPSSKVVGDMAIFMVNNGLTPENIYEKAADIDFPDSVVSYFEGMMGQPEGGFPEDLRALVLKGKPYITVRPGELLEPEDFNKTKEYLDQKYNMDASMKEILSFALYPKVYEDYLVNIEAEGDFRHMGSDVYFLGLNEGETCEVKLEEGKVLVIKLIEVKEADENGMRELEFEINGKRRSTKIADINANRVKSENTKLYADASNQNEIGANIPGNIVKILVQEGEKVAANQAIAIMEAMKMETNILSPVEGRVTKIYVKEGQQVEAGELITIIE